MQTPGCPDRIPCPGPDHGVQDDLPDAVQVAVGIQANLGERILRAHVFAPAPLQDQAHVQPRPAVLVEVNTGAAGTQIVARVLPGERVHRVLPQVALGRGLGHGSRGGLLEGELVEALGGLDEEQDAAGVLAERRRLQLGHVNVVHDDVHGVLGVAACLFLRG
jgi:hypothetical protein